MENCNFEVEGNKEKDLADHSNIRIEENLMD